MLRISRDIVLIEKISGNHGCPHFISPEIAKEIAISCSITLDFEAQKTIAEISENFVTEILKSCNKPRPSAADIKEVFGEIVFE